MLTAFPERGLMEVHITPRVIPAGCRRTQPDFPMLLVNVAPLQRDLYERRHMRRSNLSFERRTRARMRPLRLRVWFRSSGDLSASLARADGAHDLVADGQIDSIERFSFGRAAWKFRMQVADHCREPSHQLMAEDCRDGAFTPRSLS
jgi:hypothetical protein